MEISEQENDYIRKIAAGAKSASIALRQTGTIAKNRVLKELAKILDAERETVKKTNSLDIEKARQDSLSDAMIDRLKLSDKVIDSMIQSLHEIAALKDPVGEIVSGSTLPNGLLLKKVRVPIGVVGIIYESRPNVTIDVGALALKSSNAAILRGGKEALHSNKLLMELFQKAMAAGNIDPRALQLVDQTQRSLMYALIRLKNDLDLIVPRGGEGLINFVTENSLVPVVKHDKGVCHIYVHPSAAKEQSIAIILNSKTQRPGVCNAAETLLLDEGLGDAGDILKALTDNGVTLHGDAHTRQFYKDVPMEDLTEEGYHKEYLSLDISVRAVAGLSAAIGHINEFSSSHSEAILAEDYSAIDLFLQSVDSAALFVNASTRFHDGGQFGLGAEVGISTGKLHCRGPMGLTDLTTTKYIVAGNGQVRP